jgi:hypothetical protein
MTRLRIRSRILILDALLWTVAAVLVVGAIIFLPQGISQVAIVAVAVFALTLWHQARSV